MSERLTDEQVDCVIEYANVWPTFPLAVEVKALRAERVKLERALRPLAKQALTEEMDVETEDGADYEYAYNEMVRQVRVLLAQPAESGGMEGAGMQGITCPCNGHPGCICRTDAGAKP